jgi:hypothetical protein
VASDGAGVAGREPDGPGVRQGPTVLDYSVSSYPMRIGCPPRALLRLDAERVPLDRLLDRFERPLDRVEDWLPDRFEERPPDRLPERLPDRLEDELLERPDEARRFLDATAFLRLRLAALRCRAVAITDLRAGVFGLDPGKPDERPVRRPAGVPHEPRSDSTPSEGPCGTRV